jgi:hypothetical protein
LEVSAKTGQRIEDIFYNLGKKIKEDIEMEFKEVDTVKITKTGKSGHDQNGKNCQCCVTTARNTICG